MLPSSDAFTLATSTADRKSVNEN